MKKRQEQDSASPRKRAPWHLWLIGLLFIYIYANGVCDFFMMLGHNADYYSAKGYGEAVHEYFTNYPLVPLLFWVVNISTGLLAPILLLARTRWATVAALISVVSMLFLQIFSFSLMNRWEVLGPWISIFDLTLLVMTAFLYYYCRWMEKRGVLK